MNATGILLYGNKTLLHALEGLTESDWNTPDVCGNRSARDVVAHLASCEHVLVEVLNSFLGGDSTPYLDKTVADNIGFNDE